MAKLMHQGVGLECRDDVSVADFGELVTLLGETLDVDPHGFALFLPATFQIPRVTKPHVRVLKVVGEDLLEILPIID
jgi:hypothetical protein